MASMAIYLRSRPRSFLRASAPVYSSSSRSHFSSSSSSSPDPRDENAQTTENNQSNSRSSWNDVRSKLQGRDWRPSQQPPRQGFSFSQGAKSPRNKPVDLMQIRKSLSEFKQRSDSPSGPPGVRDPRGESVISFQDLYKKMSDKSAQGGGSADKDSSPRVAISSIMQHLKKSPGADNSNRQRSSAFSLSKYQETLESKPREESNTVSGRAIDEMSGGLPHTVFGKELKEKEEKVEDANALVKDYSKNELGEKLKQLRPDGVKQGGDWFSLSELNERLIKLRELDKQEKSTASSASFRMLRDTLEKVKLSDNENDTKTNNLKFGFMGQLGGTPAYMLAPPKENLVEKYFHPDNMSSAEKLKLELKAVRDEFKMSETDCGSTRVQIAQLTTEISHLSKVLHKKDKHSKKGLLAKVQLRKKLLKYLRRTDWDSYCFILSKLGLRDNPGYKQ